MIQVEKLGIYLSKSIAFVLVLIYLLQSGLLIYLVKNKFDLERQVNYQQQRMSELEEKLQILKAIEDYQIGFNEEEVGRIAEVVYSESKKYQYDPMFVLAIILTESSFRRYEASPLGALGLMQVKPSVGEDLADRADVDWQGSTTLFNAETNIKLGTFHLFEQILKFRDLERAIVAYNVGETRLRGLLRQGQPLPEHYLRKVLGNYKTLKEAYPA